ncbi:MAG: hypothetical protein Q7J47_16570 [Azoarcus sp.]|nr:hypothetical protein [Azoarcus sp.]
MKKSLAMTVCTAAFLAAYAGTPLAQDAKVPAPDPAATTTPSDSPMDMSKHMGQFDEHMKKMQALHDRMSSATTPEARQKIMAEQRQEMQQGMSLMKPMMQGGAGMGGMGRGMMAQKGQPGDANLQMQIMQKRMDMMQTMMETMMDHQGMMAAPQSRDAPPTK